MSAVCPTCEPDNPAARYADTCVQHRVRDSLPAHYSDCDRFRDYNYGTRQGDCDCTATADFEALLSLVDRPSPPSAPFLGAGVCDLHEVCRRGEHQCPYHQALASSDATPPVETGSQPAASGEQTP